MTASLSDVTETSWAESVANARVIHADDPAGVTVETPADDTPPRDLIICDVCGEIVPWQGGRGRKPKRHKECRPGAKGGTTGTTRRGAKTKAERESADLAQSFLRKVNQAAILVGVADPFDGYVIAIGGGQLAKDIEGTLPRYDKIRAGLLDADGTSSVLSIPLHLVVLIVLPILAHHGIIPKTVKGKPVGDLLENIPNMFSKLEKQTAAAAEKLQADLAGDG